MKIDNWPLKIPCKARRCLLVSTWFQVLFHSPLRGTFHLSLTVLVHYRWVLVFSLGWWSTRPRVARKYQFSFINFQSSYNSAIFRYIRLIIDYWLIIGFWSLIIPCYARFFRPDFTCPALLSAHSAEVSIFNFQFSINFRNFLMNHFSLIHSDY